MEKDNYYIGGLVYVLENTHKEIKIGISNNIDERIKTLANQGGNIFVKTFVSKPCLNYQQIELDVHKVFQKDRYIGEWFSGINFNEAVKEIKKRIKIGTIIKKEYNKLKYYDQELVNKLDGLCDDEDEIINCINTSKETKRKIIKKTLLEEDDIDKNMIYLLFRYNAMYDEDEIEYKNFILQDIRTYDPWIEIKEAECTLPLIGFMGCEKEQKLVMLDMI